MPCGEPVVVEQGHDHDLCCQLDRMHLPAFVAFRAWLLDEATRLRGPLG